MNTMTKLPIGKPGKPNQFLKSSSYINPKKKQSVDHSQQTSTIMMPIIPPLRVPRTELPSSLKNISDFIQELSSSVLSNPQHLTSIDWTKNFKLSFKNQSILISPVEFLSGILKSFFKNDSAHKLAFFLFQHFLLKTHSQNESTPTSLDFSETFSTFTSNQIKETSSSTRLLQTQAAQDQTSTTILSDKPINSTILNPTLYPSASSHDQAIMIDMNLVVNALLALAIAACVLIPLVILIARACLPNQDRQINNQPQPEASNLDIESQPDEAAMTNNINLSSRRDERPEDTHPSSTSRDQARHNPISEEAGRAAAGGNSHLCCLPTRHKGSTESEQGTATTEQGAAPAEQGKAPAEQGKAPAEQGAAATSQAKDSPKPGEAEQGAAKQGAAKQGAAKQGAAQSTTPAEQGAAEQGEAEQGEAEQGEAEQGAAKQGAAESGDEL